MIGRTFFSISSNWNHSPSCQHVWFPLGIGLQATSITSAINIHETKDYNLVHLASYAFVDLHVVLTEKIYILDLQDYPCRNSRLSWLASSECTSLSYTCRVSSIMHGRCFGRVGICNRYKISLFILRWATQVCLVRWPTLKLHVALAHSFDLGMIAVWASVPFWWSL